MSTELPAIVVGVEAAPEPLGDWRASTFHPSTMELIAGLGLGIADEMVATGLPVPKFQHRDRKTGLVAELDLGLLADETAFPFRLQLNPAAQRASRVRRPAQRVHPGHRRCHRDRRRHGDPGRVPDRCRRRQQHRASAPRCRPVLGNRGQANYAAAKAGLQGFTKTLAFGVTVNAVAPGVIATDMTRATADHLGADWDTYVARRAAEIPVGRAGEPVDIANAVSFFCGEARGSCRARSCTWQVAHAADLVAISPGKRLTQGIRLMLT